MKKQEFIPPTVRKISLDPTVSLTMMSTPPGNPDGPMIYPRDRKPHRPFQSDPWPNPFGEGI